VPFAGLAHQARALCYSLQCALRCARAARPPQLRRRRALWAEGGMAKLEVCIDSVRSARAALSGGAVRVELCAGLTDGGLSPSPGLLKTVLAAVGHKLEVVAMVRPRPGDFLYDADECAAMLADVEAFRDAGAHGVVIGALTSEGRVDKAFVKMLVETAQPLPVTFHRAIDVCLDPVAAVQDCAEAGVKRILTSGGRATALEGADTIARMVETAQACNLEVIAAGGVDETNARAIRDSTRCPFLHGTLRSTFPSMMQHRRDPPVYMGAEKANTPATEYSLRFADPGRVEAVAAALGQPPSPAAQSLRGAQPVL